MHAYIESSHRGADHVARDAESNPLKVLMDLMEANPGLSKEQLFDLFEPRLEESAQYQRAVNWYYFANFYSYATGKRHGSNQRHGTNPNIQAARRDLVAGMVNQIHEQIVLLDLTMTNGKALRDCTFQEVATFSNRFAKLATKGKKTELVGAVLDEAAVQAIMK